MNDDFETQSGVSSVPVADVRFDSQQSGGITTNRSYNVYQPREEVEDFCIEVRASQISEALDLLQKAERNSFGELWQNFCLALATLFAGASLSSLTGPALISNNSLTISGIFYWIVFPMLSVGLLFGFFMLKQRESLQVKSLCSRLTKLLPNPDEAIERTFYESE